MNVANKIDTLRVRRVNIQTDGIIVFLPLRLEAQTGSLVDKVILVTLAVSRIQYGIGPVFSQNIRILQGFLVTLTKTVGS